MLVVALARERQLPKMDAEFVCHAQKRAKPDEVSLTGQDR